jgi:hypothetical protein
MIPGGVFKCVFTPRLLNNITFARANMLSVMSDGGLGIATFATATPSFGTELQIAVSISANASTSINQMVLTIGTASNMFNASVLLSSAPDNSSTLICQVPGQSQSAGTGPSQPALAVLGSTLKCSLTLMQQGQLSLALLSDLRFADDNVSGVFSQFTFTHKADPTNTNGSVATLALASQSNAAVTNVNFTVLGHHNLALYLKVSLL